MVWGGRWWWRGGQGDRWGGMVVEGHGILKGGGGRALELMLGWGGGGALSPSLRTDH